jgi:hypothetical protein
VLLCDVAAQAVSMTLRLADQQGKEILGSRIGIEGIGEFETGASVEIPEGTRVFTLIPGLDNRPQGSGLLQRAETVVIALGMAELVFEWKTAAVNVDLVDQNGQSIPGSAIYLTNPAGDPWGWPPVWAWETLPTQAVLPVNDPNFYPTMFDWCRYRDGNPLRLCPGIGDIPAGDGHLLARPEKIVVEANQGAVRMQWVCAACSLAVIDSGGRHVLASRFDFNGVQYRTGSTLNFPITDTSTYSGLWGWWTDGYPIKYEERLECLGWKLELQKFSVRAVNRELN